MERLKPAKKRAVVKQVKEREKENKKKILGTISAKDQITIICLVVIIAILSCLILLRISHLDNEDKLSDEEVANQLLLKYAKEIYKEDTIFVHEKGEHKKIHLTLEGMRDYYDKDTRELTEKYGCHGKNTYILVEASWDRNEYSTHLECSSFNDK